MRNRILFAGAILALMGIGVWMDAQNPPGAYTSPATGGVCSNCITNNPTASNQTIQPGDTTSIPLTIKEASGTTSTNDFQILNSGGATLFSISNGGTTITLPAANTNIQTSSGNNNIVFGLAGGTGVIAANYQHFRPTNINNAHMDVGVANNDMSGKLTCASSTVTKTFSLAFTSTPTVILSDETTAGGAHVSAISNTAFTVACTGATDVVDYLAIGNPN